MVLVLVDIGCNLIPKFYRNSFNVVQTEVFIFNIISIDQFDLKTTSLQNLKNRNPVNTGGFHCHSLDATFAKPVSSVGLDFHSATP